MFYTKCHTMKITHVLKEVSKDRALMLSWVILALLCLIFTLLLAFKIHPTELNTQIRFTAFGVTHIYSNAWYYLVPMALFSLTVLALHSALAAKLYIKKSKYVARLFLWLSIAVVIVGVFIGWGVFGLASI